MGSAARAARGSEWGARITGYMRELKSVFEPAGVLNPGVMFATGHRDFSSDGWLEYLVGP
ncbi:MAG: FAD-linked oxidase C-terminal domain-containing protein [Spirochaetota bacterium]